MQLHQLKRNIKAKRKKRIGRGGPHGKTSGRGHKGQKARAGHRIRPEIRDMIKKLPKRRGYRTPSFRNNPIPVNIDVIEKSFSDGETVSPKTLIEKGILKPRKGSSFEVKILGTGTLNKKITISDCMVSESVREKVRKAGGTIKTQDERSKAKNDPEKLLRNNGAGNKKLKT
jgi:large subunit ribosomal protein L15